MAKGELGKGGKIVQKLKGPSQKEVFAEAAARKAGKAAFEAWKAQKEAEEEERKERVRVFELEKFRAEAEKAAASQQSWRSRPTTPSPFPIMNRAPKRRRALEKPPPSRR